MRKIFPFELFHLGGDEVNTGQFYVDNWHQFNIHFYYISY